MGPGVVADVVQADDHREKKADAEHRVAQSAAAPAIATAVASAIAIAAAAIATSIYSTTSKSSAS